MKIKHILFPVDFSPRSLATVPHVTAAARRFGAAVTLLHLVEIPALAYGPVETLAFPALQPAALKTRAEEMMDRFAEAEFEGLRARRVVETGDPAVCIAALAQDWDIDLIMMPTRGRGVFRAALLGSIASKVLHDARCPVWTAAHAGEPAPAKHVDWRNIVCAVGLSPASASLLRVAEDLHDTLGAAIRVVHVVPGEEAFPQRLMDQEFENSLRERAIETIRGLQGEEAMNFEVAVESGDISRAVADYAREVDADLLLVGRGRNRGRGGLRSHTYGIIRDADCPVLSI